MPSLQEHHSQSTVKALYIGDSGSGKTGSLVSLVKAGYKLAIVDADNGLDVLVRYIQRECPEKLGNVYFATCTDKLQAQTSGAVMPVGEPKAFARAQKLLSRWKTEEEDLGTTSELSPDEWIIVVDSLTFLGDTAFRRAQRLNPNTKDPRQWYNTAQSEISQMLALLYSEEFKPNVIVTSHITYIERDEQTTKGYPLAIGRALSPKIGRYFNSALLATSKGSGQSQKRIIRTVSEPFIDLKVPDPNIPAELPLGSGLADYFSYMKSAKTSNPTTTAA